MRVHIEAERPTDAQRESFRVRSRIRRVERQVRNEEETTVHVGLYSSTQNCVVVRRSNFEFVASFHVWDKPRVDVLELVVAIPRALGFRALLGEEGQLVERGRAFGLIKHIFAALTSHTNAAVIPVLQRSGGADRVDARVAEHRRVGSNHGLVQVRFVGECRCPRRLTHCPPCVGVVRG